MTFKNKQFEKEIRDCIYYMSYKLKTKLKIFQKVSYKTDEINIKFFDDRIESVCKTVQLPDDVIKYIFSFI